MSSLAERCPRTDAVLAVHLDGDFTADRLLPTRGDATPQDPAAADDRGGADGPRGTDGPGGWFEEGNGFEEKWDAAGWGFVSGVSLREHLAHCAICQRALQRARRLDAALAADAGRAVADLLVAHQRSNARPAADGPPAFGSDSDRGSDSGSRSLEEFGRMLVERAVQRATSSTAPVPDAAESAVATRRSSTMAAALLVAAAVTACWLLLGEHAPATHATSIANPANVAVEHDSNHGVLGEHGLGESGSGEMWTAGSAAAGRTRLANDTTPTGLRRNHNPDRAGETRFPLAAARRFAQNRSCDSEGPSPEQLAAVLADRDASRNDRITAGARLAQMASAPFGSSRACSDQLLRALAACGDADEAELEVQRTLLAQLRVAPLATMLEQRLQVLTNDPPERSPAAVRSRGTSANANLDAQLDVEAALVVAVRAGGDRLDTSLRRLLRTRSDLDTIVTQALRGATRNDGGARLLLACWQDRVAAGEQPDSPAAALHWFTGMSPATFATVREVLETSNSAPERVRCLLALGCVGDDSTTACLLAHLRSGRRLEACAASAALSSLPHSALRPLLQAARTGSHRGDSRSTIDSRASGSRTIDDALLRLALCRAGLTEAAPWLAALDLTDRQRNQLHDAPLTSFAEMAGWFRDAAAIAD